MADRSSIPSVGRFSDAHGNAKASGTAMVFEAVPDGVRPATAVTAAPKAKSSDTRFTSDTAREAARRRWELAKLPDFAVTELEFVPAAVFEPFEPGRRDLIAAKQAELYGMTDCSPSVGVMTTVRGYAWLISFAECWAVEAGKTGDPEHADRARRFFKDASIELAKAHELHRAESAARPRAQNQTQQRLAAQRASAALPLTRQPVATVAAESAPARQPDAFPRPERTPDD